MVRMSISDLCNVLLKIQRLWAGTPVGLNLGCMVLLSVLTWTKNIFIINATSAKNRSLPHVYLDPILWFYKVRQGVHDWVAETHKTRQLTEIQGAEVQISLLVVQKYRANSFNTAPVMWWWVLGGVQNARPRMVQSAWILVWWVHSQGRWDYKQEFLYQESKLCSPIISQGIQIMHSSFTFNYVNLGFFWGWKREGNFPSDMNLAFMHRTMYCPLHHQCPGETGSL